VGWGWLVCGRGSVSASRRVKEGRREGRGEKGGRGEEHEMVWAPAPQARPILPHLLAQGQARCILLRRASMALHGMQPAQRP
jgi:hypothetical protein